MKSQVGRKRSVGLGLQAVNAPDNSIHIMIRLVIIVSVFMVRFMGYLVELEQSNNGKTMVQIKSHLKVLVFSERGKLKYLKKKPLVK